MKRLLFSVATACFIAILAISGPARGSILLQAEANNRLTVTNSENLYDSLGNYKDGTSIPAIGDFLVGILNVTTNQANGWASSPNLSGVRDTYTGVFVQRVTNVNTAVQFGTTFVELTLAAPQTGDPTTFTGGGGLIGGIGDSSSFSTMGVLDYSKGDMVALYHQSSLTDPLYASVNGTVASQWAIATESSLYATLNNTGVWNPSANLGADGNFYSSSTGTLLPSFGIKNFTGLYVDVNNTGFPAFHQIADSNYLSGSKPVSVYLESTINYNTNGRYGGGTQTSYWDFQSSDPVNLNPLPEPTSLIVFGGIGLLAAAVARWRKAIPGLNG